MNRSVCRGVRFRIPGILATDAEAQKWFAVDAISMAVIYSPQTTCRRLSGVPWPARHTRAVP
jgi:hypothetical protein